MYRVLVEGIHCGQIDRHNGAVEYKAHDFPVGVEPMLTVNSLSAAPTTYFQICRQTVNTMFRLKNLQKFRKHYFVLFIHEDS